MYLANPAPPGERHTEQKVYAALATAYPRMNVDCEDIGIANGIDTCSGVVYVSDYIFIVVGVGVGLLLLCGGVFIVFRYRRKFAEPENNPRFISPRGEMNHSMDLLEKAFASRQSVTPDSSHSDSDEEIEALNRKYIESRAEDMEDLVDNFTDEDDDNSSNFHEIVALTSTRRGDGHDII